jgi:CDP-diglyceride synthetase
MNKLPILTRRPRLYSQRSAKVKPKRSPNKSIKQIINTLTMFCALVCLVLIAYAIYIALPHIGYGLWLMLPCLIQAAIIALIGASLQAFLQWSDRDG